MLLKITNPWRLIGQLVETIPYDLKKNDVEVLPVLCLKAVHNITRYF